MEQYIPKSAVENILRNLWKEDDGHNAEHRICYNKALQEVQCEINTLEVKGVDLDKEIQRQYNVHKNPDNSIVKGCVIMTKDGFEYFAKHFFELGLKTQK